MDYPETPYILEDNLINNNTSVKSSKSFNIISDKNHLFIVNLNNCYNYIQIKAYLENDNINNNYEKLFFLNDLKNNKYLSLCDSIDEIFEQLIYELQKNKKYIKEEDKKIIIKIPVEHLKVKEIELSLEEKKKKDKELMEDLFKEIKTLKNDNNMLKKVIFILKNDMDILKIENKKINEKNNYLEEKIKIIENKLNNDFNKSSIINNDINKQNAIINWIKESINVNSIKYELIFKMSENGCESKDFHKYCDNKGPTLTIIKTTKNRVFGGFTPLNWGNKFTKLYDDKNQTFIFSLNLMKKYNIINKKTEAIIWHSFFGPRFGCDDFRIHTNMKIGITYANKNCNFLSNNNLELTGGKGDNEEFEIEEMEVFKIIY